MTQQLQFGLRPTQQRPTEPTLEGAFRIHFAPNDLKSLGLQQGDLIRLVSVTEGGTSKMGLGSTFLAATPNAGSGAKRYVQVTDTFKETYGFTLEDRVTVRKALDTLQQARMVYLKEVVQGALPADAERYEELEDIIRHTLRKARFLVLGGAFDVVPYGDKKTRKRRFIIEKIEPPLDASQPYEFTAKSKVQIVGSNPVVAAPTAPGSLLPINSDGIGGLHEQIRQLNEILDELSNSPRLPPILRGSRSIMLHGPAGTGKSMLLQKLKAAGWRRVFEIGKATYGHAGQNQSAVRKIFEDAAASPPSMIVIDRLDSLAGKDEHGNPANPGLAQVLETGIESVKESQVLIAASAQNLGRIDGTLRSSDTFEDEIEIPVPYAKARAEILRILRGKDPSLPDTVSDTIGERTHGYVGKDLKSLHRHAQRNAYHCPAAQDDFVHVKQADGPPVDEAEDGVKKTPISAPFGHESVREASLDDFEQALRTVRPTAMKEVFLEPPKVRWAEIAGSEHVKQALFEVAELPYKRPDIVAYVRWQTSRATESDLNFFAVQGAELTSMWVGETERALREIFRKARAASPSIIFFDEIDAIAAARGRGAVPNGLNVLTTLLNEMDGIETKEGVLVLAATNKPEILDAALMRPGRFDAMLYVGPPNQEARRQIIDMQMEGRPLAEDLDLDDLARVTEGYSGAEMVEICSEAAKGAGRDCLRGCWGTIGREHFDMAMKHVVRGITPEMQERYQRWSKERSAVTRS
ncbi:AAA+-type ATPase [Coniosporium tulheliwenetii]|uniref:AAA+-type ATPase n=1 Tax=Coniosporium tulheliwenetii TaxID=3383036 RepID=A0ACC2ZFV3_9PEZI|nr:AAA+-type ATPase [Cladosporium sp. JES 115]